MSVNLSASLEDYLEALYHIIIEKQAARAKDLVVKLNVTAASVTGALKLLSEKGLVHYAPYEVITLTKKGETTAKDIVRKHEILKDFFINILAVDSVQADEAACEMEHSIPRNVLDHLMNFLQFLEHCPRGGKDWIKKYKEFCHFNNDTEECIKCSGGIFEKNIETLNKLNQQTCSLDNIKKHNKAKLMKIIGNDKFVNKLNSIGLKSNAIIEVEGFNDSAETVNIIVNGYHQELPLEIANNIMVIPME